MNLLLCCKCKNEKDEQEFAPSQRKKRKHTANSGMCKACFAEYGKARRQTPKRRYAEVYYSAKQRSIPFTLTYEEFVEKFWEKPCFYCGSDTNGGIDRVNSDGSYSVSNTFPCCGICNRMKSVLGYHEFILHIRKIALHLSIVPVEKYNRDDAKYNIEYGDETGIIQ